MSDAPAAPGVDTREDLERVRAIWRVAAGLARDSDRALHDHAAKSALAGSTLTPVPGTAPTTTPPPGTEETPMEPIDPIKIREELLSRMAFHRAGLPKRLQEREGQEIFIDAVVQGVLMQQHFNAGDADAIARSSLRTALDHLIERSA